jgi:hypothetical protein
MDFNQLLSRMKELDQPAVSSVETPVVEYGATPMPTMGGMSPSMNDQPPPAHPSMSVNLNAQGMDNIESLLKLMTKVNPDMINQPSGIAPPMPSMTSMPSLTPPGPSISSIGDLGNLDSGPLKMLPDLDKEPEGDHAEPDADNMGGPSDMDADNMPAMMKIGGDDKGEEGPGPDGSADHEGPEGEKPEADDKDEKDDKKEEYAGGFDQASTSPDPELKSSDYMLNKLSGGLGRQQKMTKHGYQQGDNPLAMRENLRASIKQELAQRLAEAKSEKFDALKHVKNPTKGEKDAAKDVNRGSYADRAAMLKSAEKDGRLKETTVTELSKDTLKSYQDKAGKDIVHAMTSGDYMTTDKSAKKVMNRFKGSEKADNKIYKKDNA